MTYQQAMLYLQASYKPDTKKGLSQMAAALQIMGNPQQRLKIIHVAGTNGKGSVCAMLAAILSEAGYNVGKFTSPHLHVVNERIAINNSIISNEDFARYMSKIADVSEKMFGTADTFSFFEILTLMAFDYFAEQGVDFVLLEVGIGGRLDATNVIKSPLLAVIMSIGLDHMEILGNTVEEIAKEKAGIIKQNCPVVLYPNTNVVYNIIADIATEKKAKIFSASDVDLQILNFSEKGTSFIAFHEYFGKINIELNLPGFYQQQNAACAIAACVALNKTGIKITAENICRGLAQVNWGGRMEIAAKNPTIVLEGAHNLQGAHAAAKNMVTLFDGKEITLLAGILQSKQYTEILHTMSKHAKNIVLTKPKYDFKAIPPAELAAALTGRENVHVIEDCVAALKKAKEIAGTTGVIFCAGSLYLVGDIRAVLIENEDDNND